MKTLTVGFSRPRKWKPLAALIQAVEGTNFSHTYVRLDSPKYNRQLIYQASGLEVNFVGSVLFDSHVIVVHEFQVDVSDETYVSLMQWCIDWAGDPYSIKQLFGIGFVKLILHFDKDSKVTNPWSDGAESWVCSELVGEILRDAGVISLSKEELSVAGPSDIYQLVSAAPAFRRITPINASN